jgi:hypothetical protein
VWELPFPSILTNPLHPWTFCYDNYSNHVSSSTAPSSPPATSAPADMDVDPQQHPPTQPPENMEVNPQDEAKATATGKQTSSPAKSPKSKNKQKSPKSPKPPAQKGATPSPNTVKRQATFHLPAISLLSPPKQPTHLPIPPQSLLQAILNKHHLSSLLRTSLRSTTRFRPSS